ncbi:tight adherance operon protein [Rosenbergiella epipactidis]|uniref:tetratricopeptide repeat protein n=1 Tax=Rosenbergiella epipactidis TaxID=1544694 RepID=UPI001BD9D773|nr:tight adherance operon protein [Rosenbergiella epipactidis]MBT0719479.1 tight adherance operon protein [Rosenbergiella epipactidis]
MLTGGIIGLTGCVTDKNSTFHFTATQANETLLLKVKNYAGLIKLKRAELKKSDNAKTRYSLANYYYLSQDYRSSLYYLKPLLVTGAAPDVYLLQAKNLASLGKYKEALSFVNIVLAKERTNGAAMNLKGVLQAQMGDIDQALHSFNMARNNYQQEEDVVNNIAMIYILKKRYNEAVQLLLPIYLRGYHDPQLDHNLTVALAKSGDLRYAIEIIKKGNYSKHPDLLAADLFNIQAY